MKWQFKKEEILILSAIAAIDNNNGIGYKNELLYSHKEDMKRFKEVTEGHTVIMGYKTWKSLPKGYLPNRRNIVVLEGMQTSDAIDEKFPEELSNFLWKNKDRINKDDIYFQWITLENLNTQYKDLREDDGQYFIIGGAKLYDVTYPYLDRMYLTIFNKEKEADSFFPHFSFDRWDIIESSHPDEDTIFLTLDRK